MENKNWVKIETMEKKNWVVDIREQVEHLSIYDEEEIWKKHSIYRIPTWCADLNSKAYKPQVVSFGPYHHGEAHLKPMEEHKRRALVHFLKRTKKPIDDYMAALKEVLQQLIDSYEKLDEEWRDSEKFMQLMILDGCFMLEILRAADGSSDNYSFSDPIFSNHGKLYNIPFIRRDMMMIENQIPLLVLEKLVAVEKGEDNNEEFIHKLIMKFCISNAKPTKMDLGLHILDVVRKNMIHIPHPPPSRSTPPIPSLPSFPPHPSTGEIIHSAWKLYDAGIRFKKSKTQSLKDIKFRNGILRLPVIVVDDTTGSTFLNLMAFERLHVGAGNEVTSYVCFMDNLIDSEKDVSLLHSKGIIQNAIGSDKAAAKLFNELSKDATLEPDGNLDDVQRKVNDYCKKHWNAWRANLIHTYFRSPWAALSLIAAVFLLGLTVLQTVYSILQYY